MVATLQSVTRVRLACSMNLGLCASNIGTLTTQPDSNPNKMLESTAEIE